MHLKHVVEDDKSDFSLACVSSVTSTDEWLCDSACSFNMCFRKEWFFDFTELDGGVVHLADNQPCKIAGIGSISLKNHDGSTRVLTYVRYIPKLEKNLIYLGTLESKGFTIIMQNGILKGFKSTCDDERYLEKQPVPLSRQHINGDNSSSIRGRQSS